MILKDRRLLARLMAIQDIGQRELSRRAGFRSHTYLGRLLKGTVTSCTADRAVAICAVLQVPLDSLFVSRVSSEITQEGAQKDTRPRVPRPGSRSAGRGARDGSTYAGAATAVKAGSAA